MMSQKHYTNIIDISSQTDHSFLLRVSKFFQRINYSNNICYRNFGKINISILRIKKTLHMAIQFTSTYNIMFLFNTTLSKSLKKWRQTNVYQFWFHVRA